MAELYQAKCSYKARSPNELSLEAGDLVLVAEISSPWMVGQCQRTKEIGYAPSNFFALVESLPTRINDTRSVRSLIEEPNGKWDKIPSPLSSSSVPPLILNERSTDLLLAPVVDEAPSLNNIISDKDCQDNSLELRLNIIDSETLYDGASDVEDSLPQPLLSSDNLPDLVPMNDVAQQGQVQDIMMTKETLYDRASDIENSLPPPLISSDNSPDLVPMNDYPQQVQVPDSMVTEKTLYDQATDMKDSPPPLISSDNLPDEELMNDNTQDILMTKETLYDRASDTENSLLPPLISSDNLPDLVPLHDDTQDIMITEKTLYDQASDMKDSPPPLISSDNLSDKEPMNDDTQDIMMTKETLYDRASDTENSPPPPLISSDNLPDEEPVLSYSTLDSQKFDVVSTGNAYSDDDSIIEDLDVVKETFSGDDTTDFSEGDEIVGSFPPPLLPSNNLRDQLISHGPPPLILSDNIPDGISSTLDSRAPENRILNNMVSSGTSDDDSGSGNEDVDEVKEKLSGDSTDSSYGDKVVSFSPPLLPYDNLLDQLPVQSNSYTTYGLMAEKMVIDTVSGGSAYSDDDSEDSRPSLPSMLSNELSDFPPVDVVKDNFPRYNAVSNDDESIPLYPDNLPDDVSSLTNGYTTLEPDKMAINSSIFSGDTSALSYNDHGSGDSHPSLPSIPPFDDLPGAVSLSESVTELPFDEDRVSKEEPLDKYVERRAPPYPQLPRWEDVSSLSSTCKYTTAPVRAEIEERTYEDVISCVPPIPVDAEEAPSAEVTSRRLVSSLIGVLYLGDSHSKQWTIIVPDTVISVDFYHVPSDTIVPYHIIAHDGDVVYLEFPVAYGVKILQSDRFVQWYGSVDNKQLHGFRFGSVDDATTFNHLMEKAAMQTKEAHTIIDDMMAIANRSEQLNFLNSEMNAVKRANNKSSGTLGGSKMNIIFVYLPYDQTTVVRMCEDMNLGDLFTYVVAKRYLDSSRLAFEYIHAPKMKVDLSLSLRDANIKEIRLKRVYGNILNRSLSALLWRRRRHGSTSNIPDGVITGNDTTMVRYRDSLNNLLHLGSGNINRSGSAISNDDSMRNFARSRSRSLSKMFSGSLRAVGRYAQYQYKRYRGRGGWDTKGGFSLDHISPEWMQLFDLAGITISQLKDETTVKYILDFVDTQGGIGALVNAKVIPNYKDYDDDSERLPDGWESYELQARKTVYINHQLGLTTWIKPKMVSPMVYEHPEALCAVQQDQDNFIAGVNPYLSHSSSVPDNIAGHPYLSNDDDTFSYMNSQTHNLMKASVAELPMVLEDQAPAPPPPPPLSIFDLQENLETTTTKEPVIRVRPFENKSNFKSLQGLALSLSQALENRNNNVISLKNDAPEVY